MACNMEFKTFENYVADSNKCIRFKLVTSVDDLVDDFEKINDDHNKDSLWEPKIPVFKPEMSYQIFGENENIFGFKNLTVKVYYSCGRLDIYLGLKYEDRLTKEQTDGVEPDDVLKLIATKYETKVTYNLEEFASNLHKEKTFLPYGQKVKEFSLESRRTFCIYKANHSVPGFVAYHERMQTFLPWYIEGISYIDVSDERWEVFVVYEQLSSDGDGSQFCFIGYSTVYEFWAYPQHIRPRISQFLVLPPFRGKGIGSRLLETIYENYNLKSVIDITVEDPSPEFQRMRDIVDCKLCFRLDGFNPERLWPSTAAEGATLVWRPELVKEAQDRYKLNSIQLRRVYEILMLKAIDRTNDNQYRAYRMAIKQRLNAPYSKQMNDLKRMLERKIISQPKYLLLIKANKIPHEYRIQYLDKQYQEIEKEYLQIIEKLES